MIVTPHLIQTNQGIMGTTLAIGVTEIDQTRTFMTGALKCSSVAEIYVFFVLFVCVIYDKILCLQSAHFVCKLLQILLLKPISDVLIKTPRL